MTAIPHSSFCSDGDGYDVVNENSAAADFPEPFYEGKGKDPLIRKGQFYGKGEQKRVASDSPPPSVSGANLAQRITSLFPSRSPSPNSSSSESLDPKPGRAQKGKSVKRRMHAAHGHRG